LPSTFRTTTASASTPTDATQTVETAQKRGRFAASPGTLLRLARVRMNHSSAGDRDQLSVNDDAPAAPWKRLAQDAPWCGMQRR
jgi:hypothetical protein